MVRGVNKTVIEVNCGEGGYFERAILFVNPEQLCLSSKRLQSEAEKYVKIAGEEMQNGGFSTNERSKKYRLVPILTAVLSVTIITAVIIIAKSLS